MVFVNRSDAPPDKEWSEVFQAPQDFIDATCVFVESKYMEGATKEAQVSELLEIFKALTGGATFVGPRQEIRPHFQTEAGPITKLLDDVKGNKPIRVEWHQVVQSKSPRAFRLLVLSAQR